MASRGNKESSENPIDALVAQLGQSARQRAQRPTGGIEPPPNYLDDLFPGAPAPDKVAAATVAKEPEIWVPSAAFMQTHESIRERLKQAGEAIDALDEQIANTVHPKNIQQLQERRERSKDTILSLRAEFRGLYRANGKDVPQAYEEEFTAGLARFDPNYVPGKIEKKQEPLPKTEEQLREEGRKMLGAAYENATPQKQNAYNQFARRRDRHAGLIKSLQNQIKAFKLEADANDGVVTEELQHRRLPVLRDLQWECEQYIEFWSTTPHPIAQNRINPVSEPVARYWVPPELMTLHRQVSDEITKIEIELEPKPAIVETVKAADIPAVPMETPQPVIAAPIVQAPEEKKELSAFEKQSRRLVKVMTDLMIKRDKLHHSLRDAQAAGKDTREQWLEANADITSRIFKAMEQVVEFYTTTENPVDGTKSVPENVAAFVEQQHAGLEKALAIDAYEKQELILQNAVQHAIDRRARILADIEKADTETAPLLRNRYGQFETASILRALEELGDFYISTPHPLDGKTELPPFVEEMGNQFVDEFRSFEAVPSTHVNISKSAISAAQYRAIADRPPTQTNGRNHVLVISDAFSVNDTLRDEINSVSDTLAAREVVCTSREQFLDAIMPDYSGKIRFNYGDDQSMMVRPEFIIVQDLGKLKGVSALNKEEARRKAGEMLETMEALADSGIKLVISCDNLTDVFDGDTTHLRDIKRLSERGVQFLVGEAGSFTSGDFLAAMDRATEIAAASKAQRGL